MTINEYKLTLESLNVEPELIQKLLVAFVQGRKESILSITQFLSCHITGTANDKHTLFLKFSDDEWETLIKNILFPCECELNDVKILN